MTTSDKITGTDDTFETFYKIFRARSDGTICVSIPKDIAWFSVDGAVQFASDILEVAGVQWTPLS